MSKQPLLNATMRWFLLAMIMANVAGEMAYTLMPLYLSQLGASVAQVGLTFSLASILPLALQLLGGWLSDTIGRLRAIAIGSVAASAGYILFPLAPTWQWAMIALTLEYVSGSLVGPSFGPFIAEQSPEESRGRVFGLTKGIFLSVAVIGPALGGVLAGRYGIRGMMVVAGVLYIMAAALRVWMATAVRFGASEGAERPTLRSLRAGLGSMWAMLVAGGVITWVLLTDGVQDVSYSLSWELQPLYLSKIGGFDAGLIGMLAAVRGAAMIAATLLAGWLSDRHGERKLIAAGFLLQFVGLIAFLRSSDLWGFGAAAAMLGLGFGMMIPAYDSLISKVIPEKMRGIAFGFFGTSIGLLSLPAPWLGSQLWERFGAGVPFAVTAAAALVCILPAWIKFKLPANTP